MKNILSLIAFLTNNMEDIIRIINKIAEIIDLIGKELNDFKLKNKK